MKTLVIGYGNITRQDDRAGIFAAEILEGYRLPGVETRTTQQLHVDLVSDFSRYDRIIFVDASISGQEIDLRKVSAASGISMISSHSLGPELLLRLSASTALGEPEVYLCSIRGECFDFGTRLSEIVEKRTRLAADRIRLLIHQEAAPHA